MKINIQRINSNGIPDREGNWWCWTEICDRCTKQIFNNFDKMTMDQPETDELDFCTDCYRWFLKNNISYKEAERLFGKDEED